MKTKNYTSSWTMLVITMGSLMVTSCLPPPPCGDLVISRVTMTARTGNSFNYDIEFKNTGAGSVFIDGDTQNHGSTVPYFQSYLSTDAVLDNLDKPAGGSVITQGPSYTLLTNDTHLNHFGASLASPLLIDNYPYFIVVLHTFSGSNDCDQTDNTIVYRWVDATCGDLIINRIAVTSRATNSFNYDIEFKNIGAASVFIDGDTQNHNSTVPYFQSYLSTDAVLDNLDKPAGGSVITQGPSYTLLTNDTHLNHFGAGLTSPLLIDNYPYFIVVLHTFTGSNDCNQTDNTYVLNWSTLAQ